MVCLLAKHWGLIVQAGVMETDVSIIHAQESWTWVSLVWCHRFSLYHSEKKQKCTVAYMYCFKPYWSHCVQMVLIIITSLLSLFVFISKINSETLYTVMMPQPYTPVQFIIFTLQITGIIRGNYGQKNNLKVPENPRDHERQTSKLTPHHFLQLHLLH